MKEEWQKYYTKEQLKKLQEIELENLRVFIDVCEQLGLKYIVYGGTLLGAVKYGGFVPWDDDIDVALPRDDYEKLLSQAYSVLPAGYSLQYPGNPVKYPFHYAKLRKKGTTFVEYINRNIEIETGVYIDIYPIDRVPDDEKKRARQFKKTQRLILSFVLRQARLYDKKETSFIGKCKNCFKWILSHFLKLLPLSFYIKRLNRCMTRYNCSEGKRYSVLISPNFNNTYDDLYPFVRGEFCGLPVNFPNDYLGHLRRRYGDISRLPPPEKRVGHIPYIMDLGK